MNLPKRLLTTAGTIGSLLLAGTVIAQQPAASPDPLPTATSSQSFQQYLPAGQRNLQSDFFNRHSPARPTEIRSRIKAYVFGHYDSTSFVPFDSVRLHWSGTHNSDGLAEIVFQGHDDDIWYPVHTLFHPFAVSQIPPQLNILHAATDSSDIYSWVSTGSVYELSFRTITALDTNGNILSMLIKASNGTGWENSEKLVNTYGPLGNRTSSEYLSWDGGVWENDGKYSFDYDAQGNMTELRLMNWDVVASAWEADTKELYSYDNQGRLLQRITQTGWGGSLTNETKFSYTYSGDHRTSAILQEWNAGSNQWENSLKYDYTYMTGSDLRTKDIVSRWTSTAWEPDTQKTYTYNSAQQLTTWIVKYRNGSNWDYYLKSVRDYSGGLIETITAHFLQGGSIQPSVRTRFEYNNDELVTEAVLETWNGSEWGFFPSGYNTRIAFYYETFDDGTTDDDDTGLAELRNDDAFTVYPNPASDKITITSEAGTITEIKIVDISGRVVFQSHTSLQANTVQVPVHQLAPGTYLLQVSDGNQKGTQTIVVR